MSTSVSLHDVPQRLLYPDKWAELRAFAASDLIALTYINAPFPDPDYPSNFFWGREGSFDEAVRRYHIGRELLGQCRNMLIERKLLATGSKMGGEPVIIPWLEWANMWPMFAINRAAGPNSRYDDIRIVESKTPENCGGQKRARCGGASTSLLIGGTDPILPWGRCQL